MPLRILVHDYAGHPFQTQLSRELARRGHIVMHAYSQSLKGPQGTLTRLPSDAPTLQFGGIELPTVLNKQDYVQRFFLERKYGQIIAPEIRRFAPDIVISSSAPLDSQVTILRTTHEAGAKFVFWLQDLIGIATRALLGRKLLGAGKLIGFHYVTLEKRLLRQSDAIVSITEDFGSKLAEWHIPAEKVNVIPNWAAMEEMPQRPKNNPWAQAHGLVDKFCFVYTGTMGLKHNPEYLLQLALKYRGSTSVAVVVVSEGSKAEWLKHQQARLRLTNLLVLPFQPYEKVPDMMGAADVLVAVLDPDAAAFSVPSKVLAYHCAGRPMLLSVPPSNLAARIVSQASSGAVVEPGNLEGFLAQADELYASPQMRKAMARNARAYAEQTFDIGRITDRFEALFDSLIDRQIEADELEEALVDERA